MTMKLDHLYSGDCREILAYFPDDCVDLIYLDPPFFTQKKHSLVSRDRLHKYEFDDIFSARDDYLGFLKEVFIACRRVLKETGNLFLHCDRTASHHLRTVLEAVFGEENFQSEIIWSYKRWSNSKKGLMNSHQAIYFFSKTPQFKFHTLYGDYSPTTNLDQILQERARDEQGVSVYKRDENGATAKGKPKKGVPLSDVWEIPYLNPKAKERCGYPTQKPVLLLNRIVKIASDEGDIVLDPFCGSGTTCVSAKLLKRRYIGIDVSPDAVQLAEKRLEEMIVSQSNLLHRGIRHYREKTEKELTILSSLNAFPVQRNSGIDGFLKEHFEGTPVPVKIQGEHETLEDAVEKLEHATRKDNYSMRIIVQTREAQPSRFFSLDTNIEIIQSLEFQCQKRITGKFSNTNHAVFAGDFV
jgi:site-specific DNA-methyltransferase (adenine-specific)